MERRSERGTERQPRIGETAVGLWNVCREIAFLSIPQSLCLYVPITGGKRCRSERLIAPKWSLIIDEGIGFQQEAAIHKPVP